MEEKKVENIYEDYYKGMTFPQLVEAMDRAKWVLDQASENKAEAGRCYDYLRMVAIPTMVEDEEIVNRVVPGIGRVSLTGDMFISVPAQARNGLILWLEELGRGNLVSQTVADSVLKSLVKELIKKGVNIPEHLVKVTPYTRASITKSKKEG